MSEMELFRQIETDLAQARRRADEVAIASLGLLKSEIVNVSKEAGFKGSIDDALVMTTVRKELKRRQETMDAYEGAGRTEQAARERAAAEVLRAYLPTQLTADELDQALRGIIADVQPAGPAGFGAVMKEANQRLAGRTTGSEIATAARRLLG